MVMEMTPLAALVNTLELLQIRSTNPVVSENRWR